MRSSTLFPSDLNTLRNDKRKKISRRSIGIQNHFSTELGKFQSALNPYKHYQVRNEKKQDGKTNNMEEKYTNN